MIITNPSRHMARLNVASRRVVAVAAAAALVALVVIAVHQASVHREIEQRKAQDAAAIRSILKEAGPRSRAPSSNL